MSELTCKAGIHFLLNTSYNPMLDPIPMSLAHVSYGGEGAEDEPKVEFGNKNDLTPFFGSKIKAKVFDTGKGVLSPITGQVAAPANMVRNRGKKTLEQLKSTPMDKQETAYDRRMRERRLAQLNTATAVPNDGQHRRGTMDVSDTVIETSPTSPGRPQYPLSPIMPETVSEKAQRQARPSTESAAGGYRVSQAGQDAEGTRESEDGIPLTRLSSRSEGQDPPSDPEGQPDPDEMEAFFALPGGPGVRNQDETDGNDPDAFFPPATKEPQVILWLPKDDLGLCDYEIEMNAQAGVEASCRRAILNHKGKVRISGPPPIHHHRQHVYPT